MYVSFFKSVVFLSCILFTATSNTGVVVTAQDKETVEKIPSVPFPEQKEPVLEEPRHETEPKQCPPGTFGNGSECMPGEHCIRDIETGEILCIPPDRTFAAPLQPIPDNGD